jgi:dihydrofolate synthase/folylpolyglutamate synthase
MTYQESIRFLSNLRRFEEDPNLDRMKKMLSALNNPHKNLTYVHIAGTNGKGSTAVSIASILLASKYKVGLYTSPHLHIHNERIKINNINISNHDFIWCLKQVRAVLKKNPTIKPTVFEVLTVMAFLYFSKKNVDIAVLEVGIGGRLDPTNIINGIVSVITNIDLEHTEILGNTKQKIAREKAGIIKPHSTVVIGEQNPKIQKIFISHSSRLGAKLEFLATRDIKLKKQSIAGQVFDFKNYKNIQIPFLGEHQLYNTSLAILAAEALKWHGFRKITKNTIKTGLKNTRWPLRLQIVRQSPTILIDVGHNLHGVRAIYKTIKKNFQKSKRILILGCSCDKPYKKMSQILSTLAKTIIVTKAKYHGVKPEEIIKNINTSHKTIYQTDTVRQALVRAKELAKKEDLIMVLGGLYLGAEADKEINKNFK